MVAGPKTQAPASRFRTFGFAITTTLLIVAFVTYQGGLRDTVTVVTLIVLEMVFSFDNAFVNSRLLKHLSPGAQKLFLWLGIFIAVFVIRFAVPIVIVMFTADLGFRQTIDLAVQNPTLYGEELHKAGPAINAFGGTFLVLLGIAYFFDEEKDVHWFAWLERKLAPLGQIKYIEVFMMLVSILVMAFTVPGDTAARFAVVVAGLLGLTLYIGLDLLESAIMRKKKDEDEEDEAAPADNSNEVKILTGAMAGAMLFRLEIVDASFSFDGVIGAFAITSSILLIMPGLGSGAVWVRSFTIHLLQTGALKTFKYLEHGAMWAILFLGLTMFVRLYGYELPEWFTGSIGLVFIGSAFFTSIAAKRRANRQLAARGFA